MSDLNWMESQDDARACISIDTASLARLIKNGQLHAEDFSCLDASSQSIVRNLILASLRRA